MPTSSAISIVLNDVAAFPSGARSTVHAKMAGMLMPMDNPYTTPAVSSMGTDVALENNVMPTANNTAPTIISSTRPCRSEAFPAINRATMEAATTTVLNDPLYLNPSPSTRSG